MSTLRSLKKFFDRKLIDLVYSRGFRKMLVLIEKGLDSPLCCSIGIAVLLVLLVLDSPWALVGSFMGILIITAAVLDRNSKLAQQHRQLMTELEMHRRNARKARSGE